MLKPRTKPLILVTNDDGVEAQGIKDLHDGIKGLGRAWVVAPAVNQSAASHSFTLRKPIRVWRLRPRWLAVHGTPTDCVLVSHHGILKRTIDLVLSGINDSPNLGDDVLYSGTVAAAIEGTMLGMPSVAVSYLKSGENRAVAIRFIRRLVPLLLDGVLPPKTLLNVNIPDGKIKGIKVTRLGRRIYRDMAIRGRLPDGGVSWTIDGELAFEGTEGTDFEAVYSGYISVTPLHLDMTHHTEIERLQPKFGQLALL
ncbi:5'/3'-nucleotidase SurE [candidate division WOR-3 bacterium]|uniref:5'-nucleotidase SurE n=1 Tax=candidate division WOR-3 bacterium TaxID=2052148 RepID=A0A937XE89_UNCW3|nr:5'/3'-nucleotidase SurE [candidate division WOR-3 bacterium]